MRVYPAPATPRVNPSNSSNIIDVVVNAIRLRARPSILRTRQLRLAARRTARTSTGKMRILVLFSPLLLVVVIVVILVFSLSMVFDSVRARQLRFAARGTARTAAGKTPTDQFVLFSPVLLLVVIVFLLLLMRFDSVRARQLRFAARRTARTSAGKIQIEPLSLQYFLIISIVTLIITFINVIAVRLRA